MATAAAEETRMMIDHDEDVQVHTRTLLVFDLAGEFCGLDVELVKEIVHVPPRITRVPNAPHYVTGVINLRGTVAPVLDCMLKMGGGRTERTSDTRIVVAEFEGIQFGVLVDAVREVRTVPDSVIETGEKGSSSSIGDDYILGVAKMDDGRLIVLIDLATLFDINELIEEDH